VAEELKPRSWKIREGRSLASTVPYAEHAVNDVGRDHLVCTNVGAKPVGFSDLLDGRQGRRDQHWWKDAVLRWDARHPSNPGGTCNGSVRRDESGVIRGRTRRDSLKSSQVNGSSGFDYLGLGFRATYFDGDLHSIFHRIFEGDFDSEQPVLVDRFGFVRFHRPS